MGRAREERGCVALKCAERDDEDRWKREERRREEGTILPEQFTEFLVAELAYPTFACGYGHICEVALVLNHLVDALLKGVLGDEAVDKDVLVLANAVGTVGGLSLDGGIPPEVVVDDMAGGGEVETGAGGLEREEHLRLAGEFRVEVAVFEEQSGVVADLLEGKNLTAPPGLFKRLCHCSCL